jgi:hypothetical protein
MGRQKQAGRKVEGDKQKQTWAGEGRGMQAQAGRFAVRNG